MTMTMSTCDLCDEHGDQIRVVPPIFRHFGGRRQFQGLVATLRCPEDNSRLKELASTPGAGRVLVVDAAGSLRYALLGDMVAKLARDHGWSGVVVHGAVRDSVALQQLDFGVMALGLMPRRSLKNGEGQAGLVIELAGVVCKPGDMLVADEDGIVLLDPALLSSAKKA
jgi:regulator of ribonuclease activity A